MIFFPHLFVMGDDGTTLAIPLRWFSIIIFYRTTRIFQRWCCKNSWRRFLQHN